MPGSRGPEAAEAVEGPKGPAAPAAAPPGSLLRWDEVPEEFVERFILSGYRRLHCSAGECLASALRPTNETLNFWTHFVALVLLAARLGRLAWALPWSAALLPLGCYASGVLAALGASCLAHLFGCRSPRLRAALFYLDYASISYYGFASTLAYYHYLLPGLRLLEPAALAALLRRRLGLRLDCRAALEAYLALLLPLALALALACTLACCRSRARPCAYPAAVRTLVFAAPLAMACPIALEGLLFDLGARRPALLRRFCRRYLWLLAAAVVNVAKLPERLRPGRFDVVGHSHQLFHVFTGLSIYEQSLYVEQGLRDFLRRGPGARPAPTLPGTLGYMLLLALGLALLLRRFLRLPPKQH